MCPDSSIDLRLHLDTREDVINLLVFGRSIGLLITVITIIYVNLHMTTAISKKTKQVKLLHNSHIRHKSLQCLSLFLQVHRLVSEPICRPY